MSCDLVNFGSTRDWGAGFSKGKKAGSCESLFITILFITGVSIGFKSEQDKAGAQRQEPRFRKLSEG